MRAGAGGTQAPTSLGRYWSRMSNTPDPGVLIGREDQLGAHEAAGSIFVQIVRPEVAALGGVIGFRRRREGRNAYRIGGNAVVEDPDKLESVLLMIEHRLVEGHQQFAIRQRQANVRSAPGRGGPRWGGEE